MSTKTYQLELTAEELADMYKYRGTVGPIYDRVIEKLNVLVEQAAEDREAKELKLPWSASYTTTDNQDPRNWLVSDKGHNVTWRTERAAKLMSAAPELLDAVKAFRDYMSDSCTDSLTREEVLTLMYKSLRKVNTGKPE
jgi:glutamyl/glutaminyl-tRNA synthetase